MDSTNLSVNTILMRELMEMYKCILNQYLKAKDFKAVTDKGILARLPEEARAKVKEIDLKTAGIKSIDKTDFINKSPYQFVVGGAPQVTAKWPNSDYARTGTIEGAAS